MTTDLPQRDTCATCRYYEDYPAGEGDDSFTGACRRHAPAPVKGAPSLLWPHVLQSDWCGEWAPPFAANKTAPSPPENPS